MPDDHAADLIAHGGVALAELLGLLLHGFADAHALSLGRTWFQA